MLSYGRGDGFQKNAIYFHRITRQGTPRHYGH